MPSRVAEVGGLPVPERSRSSMKRRTPKISYFVAKLSIVFKRLFVELLTKVILENLQILALEKLSGIILRSPNASQPVPP